MPITFSSLRAQPEVVHFLISNESPYFSGCKSKISALNSLQFWRYDKKLNVKLIGIPESMHFHISLIPRGAYFLLPLEGKQEATSGWNFTKCISEVKVNQLKVKIHMLKRAYPPLMPFLSFLQQLFFQKSVVNSLDMWMHKTCSISQFWFAVPQKSFHSNGTMYACTWTH